jgi:phage protein D
MNVVVRILPDSNMRRDRPIYTVKVYPEGKDGRVLDLTNRVLSFMYLDRSTKADRLELKVNNSDLRYFDDPVWRKDAVLEVSWGYPGNMSESAFCVIKKVTGGVELTVEALGQGILLHQVKKCRVWKNTTLSKIAEKVQFEYQSILMYESAVEKDKNLQTLGDNLQIIHATQAAMTDAEFLQRQARKFGLVFSVDKKGKIAFYETGEHMKKPPMRTITWRGGTGDWESFQIDNGSTGLFGAVTTKGIDTKTKQSVGHRADNTSTKRTGLMPTVEVAAAAIEAATYLAADVVAAAQAHPGATNTVEVPNEIGQWEYQKRGMAESVETTTVAEAGKAQLQVKAEGKFKASQRSSIKIEGSLIGDPKLAAKQNITIQGLGKRCSGVYHLIQVRHEIAHHGKYYTHFVAKGDGHGGYQEGGNVPSKAEQNTQKPNDDPAISNAVERREYFGKDTGTAYHQEFHIRGK